MYRKSLIKKGFLGFGLGSVSRADFIKYTERFIQIFEEVCGPTDVRIELYTKMPFFTSFVGSNEERERQKKFNEEGMQVLAGFSELPEAFSRLPYIKVRLNPEDESRAPSYAFGVVDFGSKLSSHIIFYVQLDEVGVVMTERLFPNDNAPKGFTLGDGFEENAGRYVPRSVIGKSVLPEVLTSVNQENRVPAKILVKRLRN